MLKNRGITDVEEFLHPSDRFLIPYEQLCNIKKAKDTRTNAQKKSFVSLVKQLMGIYNLSIFNVHCHNEYANKACPSFKINDFRKELA